MEAGGRAAPPAALQSTGAATLSGTVWFLLAALLAAGTGVLIAVDSRAMLDIALLVIGIVLVLRWPFPVLLFVIAVESRHSPFLETLIAFAGLVYLPRILRAPGRLMLIPLAIYLLFALPGVNFHGSQLATGLGANLVIPGPNVVFMARPSPEFLSWLRLLFAFSLALLAAVAVRDSRQMRIVYGTIIATGVYPILIGFQQWFGGVYVSRDGYKAVQGPLSYPAEFGFYCVIVVILALVAVFELRGRFARIGSGVVALGALVMLQHSYTRSAWIGFALAVLVLSVFHYRRLILVAIVVLALAAFAAPGAINSVQGRFGDLTSQNSANSKNSLKWRRGEWSRMIHFGTDKPVFGQGFGSYQRLTIKEFGYEDKTFSTVRVTQGVGINSVGFAAHNDYVKTYVETGVPGLILWAFVLLANVVVAARAARLPELKPWATAAAALGLAFALMSFSDNIQGYGVPLALMLAITTTLAAAYRRTARPSRSPAG
jgi:O-antigen ligase